MKTLLDSLTFEEKALLLSGAARMSTTEIERLGIEAKNFADGPHGVRHDEEENCTHFPNLCSLGASWDIEAAYKMGEGIALDCIEHDVDMILGPGINIKRNILCGRNFEYVSEDPILSGEIGAGYINGVQSKGVGTSLKHYALNNQEKYRQETSVEIDERTLREIYLRGFEIAVKKSKPTSVMCAYNKFSSIWCSENKMLLTEILRDEWGYDGYVVSDWGAVHNICKAVCAGLDLQMPKNPDIVEQLRAGVENGKITMEEIDRAVMRILRFVTTKKPEKLPYDRDAQHALAREIAAKGIVLLKNKDNVLPLTSEKYKKITVIGEYADKPLIAGQGSAEVLQKPEYLDSPLEELKKLLPDTEIIYREMYKKGEYSPVMLWPGIRPFRDSLRDNDAIILFVGSQLSEDTEKFDRRTALLNPNFDMYINAAIETGKPVIVVCQSGSAMIFDDWTNKAAAVVQMWLAGEAAGGAIADVLTGKVNPQGKLSETFPTRLRTDFEYPGNENYVEYTDKLNVGYRYYDKHPEEIKYAFGHGLSYTSFEYSDLEMKSDDGFSATFTLKNTGDVFGTEIVQVYVQDPVSTVPKPIKELRRFVKVELMPGESKQITFNITDEDLAYYNIALHKWTVENGKYNILIGSSSQDIRLRGSIFYNDNDEYTIKRTGEDMIG